MKNHVNTAQKGRKQEQGFTLLEVMVVVIIVAILATAGLPAYRSFITTQRIRTATFDMMALISFTRSEAIKRNSNITLNSNGAAFNNGSQFSVLFGATTLKQQEMFSGIQLDCVNNAGGAHTYIACPAGGIVYNGSGRLVSTFAPIELHPVNATDTTSSYYRCITVDLSGRPNTKRGPC